MDLNIESTQTLKKILKGLDLSKMSVPEKKIFISRLDKHFERLFSLFLNIYGHKYDFYFYLEQLVALLAQGYKNRSKTLKSKDQERLSDPLWYKNENMVGMACYVDLFANDLKGLQAKIPYLESLGITYLHLMPLYDSPEGDSDGGYAVSDYRKVNKQLGTSKDLKELAGLLAEKNISLVLDFVFNHTSDESSWALEAKKGNKEFQDYYYMFDDLTVPKEYERTLREIFPQIRRGNFTWDEQAHKWVWTTFNNFQWDLNYSNPAVFNAITSEMLYLANIGCGALRLDALAFIWKEMGTTCENQDKAHQLIQAFNCCLQISAPAVVFKSEAIVHPDEVLNYIDEEECQLSYNPLLMALIWDSLATRKTHLLTQSLQKSFSISPKCSWVNYIRCHDDIGWTFDDDIANQLGINGHEHRQFLNKFYTGRFEGSFAKGVAFGENPATGDCRVCGSLASLAGLEQAIDRQDHHLIDLAVSRILLVHGIILAIGGVPLLYSGDELALLNDYSYEEDVNKTHDGRWVHRIPVNEAGIKAAETLDSPQHTIAEGLAKLIKLRKVLPILGEAETQILTTKNSHVFAFLRCDDIGNKMLALYNFSEDHQVVDGQILNYLAATSCFDVVSGYEIDVNASELVVAPYQFFWVTQQ
jgi:amylosucrase